MNRAIALLGRTPTVPFVGCGPLSAALLQIRLFTQDNPQTIEEIYSEEARNRPPTIPNRGPVQNLEITENNDTSASDPAGSEFNGFIPRDKVKVLYSCSSGAGGTNRDCVKTRAEVRFKVAEADWIPATVRRHFVDKYKHRISAAGEMVIRSERTRQQQLNVADCFDKLRFAIRDCEEKLAAAASLPPDAITVAEQQKRRELAAKRRLRQKKFDKLKYEGRRAEFDVE